MSVSFRVFEILASAFVVIDGSQNDVFHVVKRQFGLVGNALVRGFCNFEYFAALCGIFVVAEGNVFCGAVFADTDFCDPRVLLLVPVNSCVSAGVGRAQKFSEGFGCQCCGKIRRQFPFGVEPVYQLFRVAAHVGGLFGRTVLTQADFVAKDHDLNDPRMVVLFVLYTGYAAFAVGVRF